jgi:DNA-binding Xre family transcriptional regulator
MIRWRIAEQLAQRGWTRYRLVQASGLATTVVYRVAQRGAPVRRIDGRTLDRLCAVLDATPGDLLAYVPGPRRRAPRPRRPPSRRRAAV